MTREEAIAYGKRAIGLGLNDETQAFCELAIKTLEQKPCEDAVSRKSVIAIIQNHWWNCRDIDKLVNELPPVTPQESRWIPVSEKYPKPEDEYKHFLVTDDKGKVSIQEFYLSLDEEPQPYFSGLVNVIAWMPMPEPYETESENEK